MIAWSISAAQESACFDRIIVSTDDEEIAEIAIAAGADVPFKRATELADDFTPTVAVIADAVAWQSQFTPVRYACCIYATAPFVVPDDLIKSRDVIYAGNCEYVMAVTSFAFPIQRAIRLSPAGKVSMFQPEHVSTRSQDLEEAFHDAGQFYWGKGQAWIDKIPIIGPETMAFRLPRARVQDIDTPEDWQRAEYMFRSMMA